MVVRCSKNPTQHSCTNMGRNKIATIWMCMCNACSHGNLQYPKLQQAKPYMHVLATQHRSPASLGFANQNEWFSTFTPRPGGHWVEELKFSLKCSYFSTLTFIKAKLSVQSYSILTPARVFWPFLGTKLSYCALDSSNSFSSRELAGEMQLKQLKCRQHGPVWTDLPAFGMWLALQLTALRPIHNANCSWQTGAITPKELVLVSLNRIQEMLSCFNLDYTTGWLVRLTLGRRWLHNGIN